MTSVAPEDWLDALREAHAAGATFFDWLGVVDLPDGSGFEVVVHLYSDRHVMLRTRLPREAPEIDSATPVLPGAAWHEREAAEMFGVTFRGHPDPRPLLLPTGVDRPAELRWPLRRDVTLPAHRPAAGHAPRQGEG